VLSLIDELVAIGAPEPAQQVNEAPADLVEVA
jgi:hypothetical protein